METCHRARSVQKQLCSVAKEDIRTLVLAQLALPGLRTEACVLWLPGVSPVWEACDTAGRRRSLNMW